MLRLVFVFILSVIIVRAQSQVKPPIVLFERLYTDANDHHHIHGEMIDQAGKVHSFDNRNDKPGLKFREWNLGKKQFEPFNWTMTPEEVNKNLSMTDSVVATIHRDTLMKYFHLLNLIAESNQNFGNTLVISGTTYGVDSTDSGKTMYGFIYDTSSKTYKRILIEYHRGVEWENQTAYIKDLKQWVWKQPHPRVVSRDEENASY